MATEYNIARSAGQCVRCNRQMQEHEEYFAVLVEDGDALQRHDWCLECWQAPQRGDIPNLFSQWRTRIPAREAKKKLFVDDDLLLNFFHRLADEQEQARLNFRFVLALVLMRKKILNYERSEKDESGRETWTLRQRCQGGIHQVVNPNLDESQISEVSEQLSQILQGEL